MNKFVKFMDHLIKDTFIMALVVAACIVSTFVMIEVFKWHPSIAVPISVILGIIYGVTGGYYISKRHGLFKWLE